MIKLKHLLSSLLWTAWVILLSGCSFKSNQSVLDPKGPVARMQFETFMVTFWVTLFLFVAVGSVLAWVTWRFRKKPGDENKSIPKQTHGSALVEVALILVSAGMLVIIAIPTLAGIAYQDDVPEAKRKDALEISVYGYQWWWEFQYDSKGLITANEIYVPIGKPVRLKLLSKDVIHSFWLPKLAGKKDLIPGQENTMWFQADEAGTYWGQCAEFCGDSHAYMLFRVHAVSEKDYEQWMEKQLAKPLTEKNGAPVLTHLQNNSPLKSKILLGHKLFVEHCTLCHVTDPTLTNVAPNLAHVASRTTLAAGWLENTPENLHKWIQKSETVKPGNLMYSGIPGRPGLATKKEVLTDANVEALVLYLQTLK